MEGLCYFFAALSLSVLYSPQPVQGQGELVHSGWSRTNKSDYYNYVRAKSHLFYILVSNTLSAVYIH